MAKNASRTTNPSRARPRRDSTDWKRLRAQTDEEIASAVARDPDAASLLDDAWFKSARLVVPGEKELISIRVDKDVLEFFRRGGPRYQTRINEVLRAFASHHSGPRGVQGGTPRRKRA